MIRSMILVDAHVHIHACFRVGRLLSAAHRHMDLTARHIAPDGQNPKVLALAEQSAVDWFDTACRHARLGKPSEGLDLGPWSLRATEENESLIAIGPAGERLILLSGRQVVTAERLELLALGTREEFAQGTSLTDLVTRVKAAGGLPVIPWGFGKWSGRRGAVLKQFLLQEHSVRFFLGDNGGRPGFLPTPKAFGLAAEQGIPVLPGSDPLPFSNEELRIGAQGFALEGELSERQPASELRRLLLQPAPRITPFGRRETLGRFLRNQVGLRLKS